MITQPMDVLTDFPVRKSKKQKEAFRRAVQAYGEGLGYPVRVEKGSFGAHNVVIGDPQTARYLVTAHYDTPARMLLPNFITPCNPLTFLAYQFLLVGVFVVVSVLAGVVAGLLSDGILTGTVAMVFYWGLLLMMLFGPANPSNANDNTSGVVSLLETAASMPENARDQVCFVLFDLEEAGLIGSSAYRKAHKKETDGQLVLNMDCVGDGNELILFPTPKLKKDAGKMAALGKITGTWGEKSIAIRAKGFSYYPSDQRHFPYGVGIAAFRRKKFLGPYCSRIHTRRDTILERTNVNILRAALVTLIAGPAAEKKG